MTTEALIEKVLDAVWKDHYTPRDREFHRDKTALIKCIARYGYLCKQRNWHVEPDFILREIMSVLQRARKQKADIKYLPAYLESAITRAVGQRSEEIAEQALNNTNRHLLKVVKEATVVNAVLQPTAVEILSTLYKNIATLKRAKKAKIKHKQPELL